MNAIILSIGDELTLGQTIDTNSAWISQQLAGVGCDISAHMTVPDDQKAIERAIVWLSGECDVLIISGGLGPTEDDLTRQALATVMQAPLELNQQWLDQMRSFFASLKRVMPESNQIQAMIPRGASMLWNHNGTAAGIRASIGHPSCEVFVMPGVPKEMKSMFTRDVLPWIRQQAGGAVILSRTLHTFGMGESSIAEKLGDLMRRDRNPSVGTTVTGGIVSLRLNARFENLDQARAAIESTEKNCRDQLGDLIFGQDDDTLASVVAGQLLNPEPRPLNPESNLQMNPCTVTCAESCTGGLLAKMLTDIPGSSAYFKMGFVTYSNRMKYERLGVSEQILGTYGAVSEPVVDAMARNAKRLAKADFALAISGIAGPDGASPTKPVGMVCIALAFDKTRDEVGTYVRTFQLPGDREMVRDRAAKMALSILRYHLLGKAPPF